MRPRAVPAVAAALLLGVASGCGEATRESTPGRAPDDAATGPSSQPSTSASTGDSEAPAGSATATPEPTLRQLLDSARLVYFAGEEERAGEMLREGLDRARSAGDVEAEARALTYLGLVAWRTYEWDESERLGVEALRLKEEHGLTTDLFTSHNALGLLRWNQNRFPEAARHYESALEYADQSPRPHAVAVARQNLGLVQVEWGQFREARAGFLAMRDSMLTIGGRIPADERARGLGAALTNLGMLENRVGNPAAAVEWLTEARRVYAEGFPPFEGRALGHLAVAYAQLGRQAETIETVERAIELARDLGDVQEEASNLEVLAEHYRASGDYRRALETYALAATLNDRIGETVATGADLRGEAEIHLELGALQSARERADRALALHREAGATYEAFYDHLTLSVIAERMGDDPRVFTAHVEEAHRLAEELGARSARAAVALTEATLADRRGDPEGVLRALAPLRPTLGRGGYDEEWRTRHLASRAWRALGQLDSAVVEGRRALETVERVRRSYGSGLLRSSFAAGKRAVYADLVETLVGQGRLAEALAVSDAARARALDEAVVEDEGSWVEESGELLLREIDRVLESAEAIESGEMSWDPGVDSLALGELYVRLAELRSRYETTVRSSGDEGRALDLAAVRRALGPNEVAVEYFVPEDGVVRVFLVTRSGVDVLDTDLTAHNLRSRVRLARALLADRATRVDDMRSVLAGMFESLLRPVLETHRVPDGADLLVVPHDVISYVPPTLWLDEERGMTVGERYRVRILPALALITTQPDARSGFGEATAFAPLTGELPATRDEAMAVGRATGATLLVDGDATEGAFRQALERSDLVHVATHGVLNTHHPLFSRIVFADGAGGSSRDDGRLEVHELLDLQAGAGLVFLSGCETGVGRAASSRYGPGEDYLTLGQAFLRAGAGAVVATLWRVDDEASATFAAHFYEALRTRSAADALRHAQRAMRQDPRYEAPYFWAGYQLLGASGPVSAEGWAGSPSEPERRVADNLP